MLEATGMNQLIHTTSLTLVLHQLGWGIPHAMWGNHAYAFCLDSVTNGIGNTNFSLAWTHIFPEHMFRLLGFIIRELMLIKTVYCLDADSN